MQNEIGAYDHPPLLYAYDRESDLPGLLGMFRKHCEDRGIDPAAVSVLTRSREFINAVLLGSVVAHGLSPWRDDRITKRVTYAKYLFDHGACQKALRTAEATAYEWLTRKTKYNRKEIMQYAQSRGMALWRGTLYRLLCDLPKAAGRISAWLPNANAVMAGNCLLPDCTLAIKSDRGPRKYSEVTFEEVFTPPEETAEYGLIPSGTIHSVKGRSLEAVFLVLKRRGATGRNYVNLLGSDLLQEEELRLVYVAATRARKALAIAVPQADYDRWREFLFAADD